MLPIQGSFVDTHHWLICLRVWLSPEIRAESGYKAPPFCKLQLSKPSALSITLEFVISLLFYWLNETCLQCGIFMPPMQYSRSSWTDLRNIFFASSSSASSRTWTLCHAFCLTINPVCAQVAPFTCSSLYIDEYRMWSASCNLFCCERQLPVTMKGM